MNSLPLDGLSISCFQGLENQLDPWDYPGARKCDASSRWTGSEHSVNL